MDLLDRYLHAIKPLLPRRTEADILRELADLILSEMEEREEALGRPLTEAEQADVIRGHGHPVIVAARYGRAHYLIGPEIFPFYWLVLRIAAIGALIVRSIVALVTLLVAGGAPRDIFPAILAVPFVLVPVFCWITGAFALFELTQSLFHVDWKKGWNPRSLPVFGDPLLTIPRTNSVAEVLFGSLALVWWIALPSAPYVALGPGANVMALGPVWSTLYWPFTLLMLTGIILSALNLVRPTPTLLRVRIRLAMHAAGLVLLCLAFRAGHWVVVAPAVPDPRKFAALVTLVNHIVFGCFVAGLIVAAAQLAWESFKHFRSTALHIGTTSILRVALLLVCASVLPAQDGATLYRSHCATCHDSPAGRTPPASALHSLSPSTIFDVLTNGVMKAQAADLTDAERRAVAAYLAHGAPAAAPILPNACMETAPNPSAPGSWTSWGVDSANTRFQPSAAAQLTAAQVPRLKQKWAFDLGKDALPRSQPAVAFGEIFVGGASQVYALDGESGCTRWAFQADAPVRSSMVVDSRSHSLFFGDQKANLYGVDARTGRLLWKTHADDHFAAMITATPALHNGVLYAGVSSFEEVMGASPKYVCCTFRGSVLALNAATGARLWKTFTVDAAAAASKSSGAAVWSTPTYDPERNLLYVSTGDNYSGPPTATSDAVLALDPQTGKLVWSRQATEGDIYNSGCDARVKSNCPAGKGRDFDFGQPPILISLGSGKRALVIGQKSGMVYAFDPDARGEMLWKRRIAEGGTLGGIQWGSAAAGNRVFVAVSDVRLKGVPGAFDVDPAHGGGLWALNAATGDVLWTAKPAPCDASTKHCSPAQSAAVSAIPGVVFSGSLDGHLRAYAAATGDVLWDMDTARAYEAVNGGDAHGGSLDVTGPVIAGGLLYLTSGYGQWGGMSGNVLLAYFPAK